MTLYKAARSLAVQLSVIVVVKSVFHYRTLAGLIVDSNDSKMLTILKKQIIISVKNESIKFGY